MDTVFQWFSQSYYGGPVWLWVALVVLAFVEWLLGRSKNPRARSLAAMVANALRVVFTRLRVKSIPVVGPLVIGVFEFVSGEDLDGDGKIVGVPNADDT